jgi:hypothetical protein
MLKRFFVNIAETLVSVLQLHVLVHHHCQSGRTLPVCARRTVQAQRPHICLFLLLLHICVGVGANVGVNGTYSSFTFIGRNQTYIVPLNAASIAVTVYGAQGGACVEGCSPGGLGGSIQAVLAVKPGETLYVRVGGAGGAGGVSSNNNGGGYNGGGSGSQDGMCRTMPFISLINGILHS